MSILSKIYFIIIVFCLISFTFFSQPITNDSKDGYLSLKINIGFFIDNDDKRFENASIKPSSVNYPLPVLSFGQSNYSPTIFPGLELNYYFERNNFFGMNIGFAYSYDKTNYSYFFSDYKYLGELIPQKQYTKKIGYGQGSGILNNHLVKFIYGFNFNTKIGLNVYIQPLNPEFRSIYSKYSVNYDTYNTYVHTTGTNIGKDSVSILVSSETKKLDFVNNKTHLNFSIAFPSLIGIEQKFKIGKYDYLAGISGSVSLLEWYAVFRAHIGVCFGNFKHRAQPGY